MKLSNAGRMADGTSSTIRVVKASQSLSRKNSANGISTALLSTASARLPPRRTEDMTELNISSKFALR